METTPKPPETADQRLLVVEHFVSWIEKNEAESVPASIVRALAKRAAVRLRQGLPIEGMTADELGPEVQALRMELNDPAKGWPDWLQDSRRRLTRFMDELRERYLEAARSEGLTLAVAINYRSNKKGGRSNKATVQLEFEDLVPPQRDPVAEVPRDGACGISYSKRNAEPRWGFGWLGAPDLSILGYRVSFATGVLCLWVGFLAAIMLGPWLLVLSVMSSRAPVTLAHLGLMLLAIPFTVPGYLWFRPWIPLFSRSRLFIVPGWYFGQPASHGQLDRDPQYTGESSGLHLVRYQSTCEVCGGAVDLDWGSPDFPARIVGRCASSPSEHVFGFDHVSKAGPLLRPEWRRSIQPQLVGKDL